jgi:hypothetical protein
MKKSIFFIAGSFLLFVVFPARAYEEKNIIDIAREQELRIEELQFNLDQRRAQVINLTQKLIPIQKRVSEIDRIQNTRRQHWLGGK